MKKKILILFVGVLPFLFISKLLFLKDPPVWPDESTFLSTASSLTRSGRLATNIFGNLIPGLEKVAYWMPPLYLYLLSFWTRIFGESIESVRALSFLLALGSLIMIFFISKLIFQKNYLSLLAILLLSIDIWFSKDSRTGRMEMLSFFLQLLSIFLFLLGEKSRKKYCYFVAGITAGLSIVTHPLGFIVSIILTAYIIFTKSVIREKIVKLGLIYIPISISLIFWFLSMKDSFTLFLIQYRLQLARKVFDTPYLFILMRQNFLWFLLVLTYILIFLMIGIKYLKKREAQDRLIVIGFFISSLILLCSKEMWYIIYFQPFVTLAALSLVKSRENFSSILIFILFALNIFISYQNFNVTSGKGYQYHVFTKSIKANLPAKSTIFLSVIPDPFIDLRKNPELKFFEYPPIPFSRLEYKKILDSSDFIIINILPNPFTLEYIKRNSKNQKVIGGTNDYSTLLVEFVSKKKRK